MPGTVDTISHLSLDSVNNLLLVPYTWDGVNPRTYNYLSAGALTSSNKPHASKLTIGLTAQKNLCYGDSSGIIAATGINGAAPYLFSINNLDFDTTSMFKKLKAGSHTIYIHDALGCTASKSISVTQPKALSLSVTTKNAICYAGASGTLTFAGVGGTTPYTYSINGNDYLATPLFSNLAAGAYTATIQDSNGCKLTKPATIGQPRALGLTVTRVSVSCKGKTDGSITLLGKGGTAPYLYSYNNSPYGVDTYFTALAPGTYPVAVNDNANCNFATVAVVASSKIACTPTSLAAGGLIDDAALQLKNVTISVYPNPSKSVFKLVLKNTQLNRPVTIIVFNMYGKTVKSVAGAGIQSFSFGNEFPTGVYTVRVQQGDDIKTVKVVKIK